MPHARLLAIERMSSAVHLPAAQAALGYDTTHVQQCVTCQVVLSSLSIVNLNLTPFIFGGQVGSPMPGVVEKVLVAKEASVSEGDVVAIVSAMKMEVQVKATTAGKVASVEVEEGGKVVEGALIITLRT